MQKQESQVPLLQNKKQQVYDQMQTKDTISNQSKKIYLSQQQMTQKQLYRGKMAEGQSEQFQQPLTRFKRKQVASESQMQKPLTRFKNNNQGLLESQIEQPLTRFKEKKEQLKNQKQQNFISFIDNQGEQIQPQKQKQMIQMMMKQGNFKSQEELFEALNNNRETSLQAQQMAQYQSEKKPKLSKEEMDELNRIFTQIKDFKPDQQNLIELESPVQLIYFQLFDTWVRRADRRPNFNLTIKIFKPKSQADIQVFKESVKYFPSIKLYIDEQLVKFDKQVHIKEGSKIMEGYEDEFMSIITTENNVQDSYQGQVKDRKQHGQGQLVHIVNNKFVWRYKGLFQEGKRQTKGQEVTAKGVTYQGQFKNDYKHGEGIEITIKKRKHVQKGQNPHVQKNRYQGQFKFGYRDGLGEQTTSHGFYKGEWKQGVKCGKGKINYNKGDQYDGQWENNSFNGQGVYIEKVNQSQNKYQGQFKDGFYHGKGTMHYANGDKYEGQWAFGKKQGQGMYEWADGDYYDGEWKKDSAEGHGAASFGGLFYDGQFHLGQKHGLGQQTNEQGDTIKAMWKNNTIFKKLEINGEVVEDEQENA